MLRYFHIFPWIYGVSDGYIIQWNTDFLGINPYIFGLFMTHSIYLTHLIYHAHYIWRILVFFVHYIQNMWGIFCGFLCKMLYMCSVFYMIFVQFLGVIKCLNNPYFTICRIAHTKKPHRAIFKVTDSYLESGYFSKIYP